MCEKHKAKIQALWTLRRTHTHTHTGMLQKNCGKWKFKNKTWNQKWHITAYLRRLRGRLHYFPHLPLHLYARLLSSSLVRRCRSLLTLLFWAHQLARLRPSGEEGITELLAWQQGPLWFMAWLLDIMGFGGDSSCSWVLTSMGRGSQKIMEWCLSRTERK